MIKKTLAILAAFSTVFAFAACGKLEEAETTKATEPGSSDNVTVPKTKLYTRDDAGNIVEIVTKTNENGDVYYEYTDANGNNVTKVDKENVVGMPADTPIEDVDKIEDLYEEYLKNPDAFYEKEGTEGLKLYDGIVPESKFVKTEVKLNDKGRPDRGDSEQYKDIFEKQSFTFKVNVLSTVDGSTIETPMSWIRSGNDMLIEVVAPFDETGKPIKGSILYKGGKCYMIMPSMKVYYEMPEEMASEMFNPDMFNEALESADLADDNVYKASYNVTLNGKTYSCDVFESKDGKTTNKNYYDANGNVVRTEMISGEDVNIWEIVELSDKADASKFVIPSGLINMSAFIDM